MITDAMVELESRVRRQPYGMMAGAVGVGFIIGGGLFTRLTARIAAVGLRLGMMAALPLVQDELLRIAMKRGGTT